MINLTVVFLWCSQGCCAGWLVGLFSSSLLGSLQSLTSYHILNTGVVCLWESLVWLAVTGTQVFKVLCMITLVLKTTFLFPYVALTSANKNCISSRNLLRVSWKHIFVCFLFSLVWWSVVILNSFPSPNLAVSPRSGLVHPGVIIFLEIWESFK